MGKSLCNDLPSTSTGISRPFSRIAYPGILKKGKSTPNLTAKMAFKVFKPATPLKSDDEDDPTTHPITPKANKVKFAYLSPSDIWRVQKFARSKSIANFLDISAEERMDDDDDKAPDDDVGRHRPSTRKIREDRGVTARSKSRTQRLISQPVMEDDVTKVFGFLTQNIYVPAFQQRYPAQLLGLSIIQYFELVKDIADTFDRSLFWSIRYTPKGIHAQIQQYKKLTLEVAGKLQIKISADMLGSPMTHRPNCSATKRKLAFLRALVDRAEVEIDKRRRYATESSEDV